MICGKLCSTLVKNRWVYLSDVLDFFEAFETEINDIRIGNNYKPISLQIIECGKMLHPLMELTYFSERRDSKLHEILPKLKETFENIVDVKKKLICKESIIIHKL